MIIKILHFKLFIDTYNGIYKGNWKLRNNLSRISTFKNERI